MPERFQRMPPWARKALFWISIGAYSILTIMGLIAVTWPRLDMELWEWLTARSAGVMVTVGSLICLASYFTHRWRWEMHHSWLVGTAMALYVLVVASYAPFADRGLLVLALTLIVLGVYARGLSLIAFAHDTTKVARRARRLAARG